MDSVSLAVFIKKPLCFPSQNSLTIKLGFATLRATQVKIKTAVYIAGPIVLKTGKLQLYNIVSFISGNVGCD
jgi:hypothetical protein